MPFQTIQLDSVIVGKPKKIVIHPKAVVPKRVTRSTTKAIAEKAKTS